MDETASLTAEFKIGARIKINTEAGPRLARREGIIVGSGRYRNSVRVTLDGCKTPMTLHKKYLSFEEVSSRPCLIACYAIFCLHSHPNDFGGKVNANLFHIPRPNDMRRRLVNEGPLRAVPRRE